MSKEILHSIEKASKDVLLVEEQDALNKYEVGFDIRGILFYGKNEDSQLIEEDLQRQLINYIYGDILSLIQALGENTQCAHAKMTCLQILEEYSVPKTDES